MPFRYAPYMLAAFVLVPAIASAQAGDPAFQDGSLGGLIPDDGRVGPVGLVNELREAHSDVTGIMITNQATRASEGYVHEEVYLEGTYVDEANKRLVVWLDPAQAFDPLDDDDIREELGIGVPLEVRYGYFYPEALGSEATPCPGEPGSTLCYWWERYTTRCLPERTTSRCTTYTTLISGYGHAPPTMLEGAGPPDSDGDGIADAADQCDSQPETFNGHQDGDGCPDTVPSPDQGGTIFQDDFGSGLGKWAESGQLEWQSGYQDDGVAVPGHTAGNLIAEADDCDDRACILSMAVPLDLSPYSSATLAFDRFVDAGLDRGEYLAVEVGNGGTYAEVLRWTDGDGDDHRWHRETVDLAGYLAPGFNVRFVTEESSSTEDVGIDNVLISGEAASGCTLSVTASLQGDGSVQAAWNDCGSDVRRYKAYVYQDGSYHRYLGSVYGGTSTTYDGTVPGSAYHFEVKAQYRDYAYTEAFASNTVTVPLGDSTPPSLVLPPRIEAAAGVSGYAPVTFSAHAYDDRDGTVPVTCTHSSGDRFPAGTTAVSCSAADLSGNTATGGFDVVVAPYMPPDSDGDGIADGEDPCPAEYGTAGGCPAPAPPSNGTAPSAPAQELRGGMPIKSYSYNPLFIEGDSGTAGLVIEHGDKKALVTASHITNLRGPHRVTSLDQGSYILPEIGSTIIAHTDVSDGSTSPADASLVEISNLELIPRVNEIHTRNGTLSVTSFGRAADDFATGTVVEVSARGNAGTGAISYTNATASFTTGGRFVPTSEYTITGLVVGTYPSEGGDSGGPVFVNYGNGTARMMGIVTGGVCEILRDDIRYVIRDDYDNCNGIFKVFTPWHAVEDSLGLGPSAGIS